MLDRNLIVEVRMRREEGVVKGEREREKNRMIEIEMFSYLELG